MLFEPHHVFEPLTNQNAKIWRYMDFAKFVSMLEKNTLFFVKANKFEDPYEGTVPKFNDKARESIELSLENHSHFPNEELRVKFLNEIRDVNKHMINTKTLC